MAGTTLRQGIAAAFILLIVLFGGLAATSVGAPLVGYEAVIVRGGSMEPAIQYGSLALVNRRETEPHPGAIVTVRRDTGVLVTHRIVGVSEADRGFVQLKGDANAKPDARPVPRSPTRRASRRRRVASPAYGGFATTRRSRGASRRRSSR